MARKTSLSLNVRTINRTVLHHPFVEICPLIRYRVITYQDPYEGDTCVDYEFQVFKRPYFWGWVGKKDWETSMQVNDVNAGYSFSKSLIKSEIKQAGLDMSEFAKEFSEKLKAGKISYTQEDLMAANAISITEVRQFSYATKGVECICKNCGEVTERPLPSGGYCPTCTWWVCDKCAGKPCSMCAKTKVIFDAFIIPTDILSRIEYVLNKQTLHSISFVCGNGDGDTAFGIKDEVLIDTLKFEFMFRPERAIFVDGQYIYKGYYKAAEAIEIAGELLARPAIKEYNEKHTK